MAQKEKVKWSIEGDENTSFFHGMLNKKQSLLISGALWSMVELESDVSNEEMKRAVWDCGIDKSPGPDVFTFGCNSSFIALIPKIPDANTIKDFRPISLIGSLYKIVAKILANRLTGVLGDIVNEVRVIKAIHGDDGKVRGYVKDGAKSCWLSIMDMDFEEFGRFSVASVRKVIDDKSLPKVDSKTRWINYVPIKVNVHAWKVKTDSLPTRFNASHRGIHIDSIMCAICDKGAETSSHLFFSCCMARQTVRMITHWWDVPYGEVDSYEDWINWFVNLRLSYKQKQMLEGVFYEDSCALVRVSGGGGGVGTVGGGGGSGAESGVEKEVVVAACGGAFWEDIWIEGKALKNRYPCIYILETCNMITVGMELAQTSLDSSFRRVPMGGVEQEQFDELSGLVHDVTFYPMSDRWIWTLKSSGDFSVASVRK
nr:RNA-directed DNA polymerase, eukaryota [Tanacetum cinerariifolium]